MLLPTKSCCFMEVIFKPTAVKYGPHAMKNSENSTCFGSYCTNTGITINIFKDLKTHASSICQNWILNSQKTRSSSNRYKSHQKIPPWASWWLCYDFCHWFTTECCPFCILSRILVKTFLTQRKMEIIKKPQFPRTASVSSSCLEKLSVWNTKDAWAEGN